MEDEKAIRILLKLHKASAPEKQYIKSSGLIHEVAEISHEKGMNWLEEVKTLCKKDIFVKNFLFSLSNRKLNYRAGLAAFAMAQNMPWHDQTVEPHSGYCTICGDYEGKRRDFTFLNQVIYGHGGLLSNNADPVTLAYYLSESLRLPYQSPGQEDIKIFNQIISLILSAPHRTTAPKLSILIGKEKIIKSNAQERQTFLETLGFLSILENPECPGHLEVFVPMKEQIPKHTHGDFAYPVDWWTTANGINQIALEYWFGIYLT
ncbi:MAG TPA: hypothetical protein VFG10_08295 [Saprospiraceae bacterium]|nr:hypothetical protein [Saprospiraceae bacterium]